MIKAVRNAKVYVNGGLPNEDYHKMEGISSSGLWLIFNDCEAVFKYGDPSESDALHYGIASHAAMLEPELFGNMFVRDLSKDDIKDVHTSDASIKARMKDIGVAGYSTKSGKELYEFALQHDPEIKIMNVLLEAHHKAHAGKTIVKADDYDGIMQMRRVMFANEKYADLFKGAFFETSVICEVQVSGFDGWIQVKVRPDIVTRDFMVPDYKTTRDVRPEEFGRLAYYAGYWLRQAFVCDVLSAVYNESFTPALLAQGKGAPFIPQLYLLTNDQIKVGREQYTDALIRYAVATETNVWPAYADTELYLSTPGYIAKQFAME